MEIGRMLFSARTQTNIESMSDSDMTVYRFKSGRTYCFCFRSFQFRSNRRTFTAAAAGFTQGKIAGLDDAAVAGFTQGQIGALSAASGGRFYSRQNSRT